MTEAISQNSENNLDVTFDLLNVTTTSNALESGDENAFSNLINTISANIEQAQSEFVDLAAQNITNKSNTSSINKLALSDSKENVAQDEILLCDVENLSETDLETSQMENEAIAALEAKVALDVEFAQNVDIENQAEKTEKTAADDQPAVEPSLSFENQTDEKTQNIKETVEISNEQKTKKEEVENLADKVFVTNFDILNQNEDLDVINSFLKDDFESIDSMDSLETIKNSIDNVLNLLHQTDLSFDEQNKIKEAFSKVRELIQKTQEKLSALESENSDEAKKILDGIVLKLVSKGEQGEIKEDFSENSINNEELKAIVKQAQMVASSESESLKNALGAAGEVLKEINEAIYNNDTVVLENAFEKLGETVENLENILGGKEASEGDFLEINKKIIEALKALSEDFAQKNDGVDVSKIQKLSDEIELNLENFKSFEIENKTQTLKLLSELKNSDFLSDSDKNVIENIIKKINDPTSFKEAVRGVFEEESNSKTPEKLLSEIDEILAGKISKTSNAESKNASKTAEAAKIQTDFLKTDDEIVLEIKFSKIPPASGALSVSDEVAKIALNEENPPFFALPTNQSHISSDSASLKQLFAPTKEIPLQKQDLESSNILNELSNKFTELKDSQGHKVNLVLRPNNLGRLSIELRSDESGLAANIIAQNSEVRTFIEKNIHILRQNLTDSGVNVNNIQIKTAGESQSSTYSDNQDFNRENSENNQNSNNQHKQQNQKEQKELLANFSNYDLHFAKDFSSVLTKTFNYNLN